MTPKQGEELLRSLREKALILDELHDRVRTVGSSWTVEQLELFLVCARGVEKDPSTGAFRVTPRGTDEALQDAVLEAVRSFGGKAVTAVHVRARLPGHFVTTDEQILAVARRAAGLEVFGPKLIRIAK